MNATDEWIRTVSKMGEDLIECHGFCGLNKVSNVMKTLMNILNLKYNSVDEFAISCYVRIRTFIRM